MGTEFRKLSKIAIKNDWKQLTPCIFYYLGTRKKITYNRNGKNFLKSATLQEERIPHLSSQARLLPSVRLAQAFWKPTFCSQEPLNVKTSRYLFQPKVNLHLEISLPTQPPRENRCSTRSKLGPDLPAKNPPFSNKLVNRNDIQVSFRRVF